MTYDQISPSQKDKTPEKPAKVEETGKVRQFHGPLGILTKALGAGLAILCFLYIAGIFFYLRIPILFTQFNAIFLAGVVTLLLLIYPAGKRAPRNKVPWYDILLILCSLAGHLYIAIYGLEIARMTKLDAAPFEMALGFLAIITLFEAVRRSLGKPMVIVCAIFLFYLKFSYLIPGPLGAYEYSWSSMIRDLYLSTGGIYGSLVTVFCTIIISFIVFGAFFINIGGGKFFTELALASTGWMTGGPSKAAIVGSGLFGTLSGSPSANVAVTGTFTIPLMKKTGYSAQYAGAIEAVASTGGQIMPPIMGSVAFVMADMIGVSYATVAAMAAIPAILYYSSLFTQSHLRAVKEGHGSISRETLPSLRAVMIEGWDLLIPFAALLLFLFVLRFPPQLAAVYSVVVLIATSMFRKQHRLNIKKFIDSFYNGTRSTAPIAAVIGAAGIIIGSLSISGLGPKISSGLISFSGGSLLILIILAAVASYVMGMGISLVATYIILSSLLAPSMITLGLPENAAHFFLVYMGTATFITPPYCIAVYIASAIAEGDPFPTAFQAMKLGIVCYLVPFIIVYNPALILVGAPGEIALASVTALIAVFALSVGIEGYLFTKTNSLQRLLFFGSGLTMIVPGLRTDIIGIGMLSIATGWQWLNSRRAKRG